MRFAALKTSVILVPLLAISAVANADPVPQPTAAKEDASQKMICKRFVETGSIAKVRKECHPAGVWQRSFESHRQDARDLVNGSLNSTRVE